MKLLFIIDSLGPGGAQKQIVCLAREMQKSGNETRLFTYYPNDFFIPELHDSGVPIVNVRKFEKLGINVAWSLFRLLNKTKFDAVISFLDTPNFYNIFCNKFSKYKPKTIISYRSSSDLKSLNWIHLKLKEWANNQATYIVSNSHHERRRWCTKYPNLQSKFRTIYNVVDLNSFKPSEHYSYEKSPMQFTIVGRVIERKNPDLVIRSFGLFKKKHPNCPFKVNWIGLKKPGKESPVEFLNGLDDKINQLNLVNNWNWKDPKQNIIEEYRESHCFILGSMIEGLPNVACEALACGLPVIITDVLDHKNLVSHGIQGLLFNPTDMDSLYHVIKEFYFLPENKKMEMRLAARKRAEQLFSEDRFSAEYLELLN